MSDNNFNSEFDEINDIDDIESIEQDEIPEVIVTRAGKKRLGRRRKWREIDNIHEQQRLKRELADLEDYDLGYII